MLKAGPRPTARHGPAARRPSGPRPAAHGPRRPGGPDARTVLLSSGTSTRMHRFASGLGAQMKDGEFDFVYHFNNHFNPFPSFLSLHVAKLETLSFSVVFVCLQPTSYPGSSRLSIWRRVLRRPWHTADHVIKICPSRMDKYAIFFKMAAKNKVRETWVRQLPTNKMEYEGGTQSCKLCFKKPKIRMDECTSNENAVDDREILLFFSFHVILNQCNFIDGYYFSRL